MPILSSSYEILNLKPHLKKYLDWHEKGLLNNSIRLSSCSPLTRYLSLLFVTEERAGKETQTNQKFSEKFTESIKVMIDLPSLVKEKRFYITEYATADYNAYLHSHLMHFLKTQIKDPLPRENFNLGKKGEMIYWLDEMGLDMSVIEDYETFYRNLYHLQKGERTQTKPSTNSIVNHFISLK